MILLFTKQCTVPSRREDSKSGSTVSPITRLRDLAIDSAYCYKSQKSFIPTIDLASWKSSIAADKRLLGSLTTSRSWSGCRSSITGSIRRWICSPLLHVAWKWEQQQSWFPLCISLRIDIPRGYSYSSLLHVYHPGIDLNAKTDKHFAASMKNNLPLVLFLPVLVLSIDIWPYISFETCIVHALCSI